MVITIITTGVFQGLFAAGIILILRKWNFLDWYEQNKKRWMPNRCEFCLSFWISAGIGVSLIPIYGFLGFAVSPFLAIAIVFNVVK